MKGNTLITATIVALKDEEKREIKGEDDLSKASAYSLKWILSVLDEPLRHVIPKMIDKRKWVEDFSIVLVE